MVMIVFITCWLRSLMNVCIVVMVVFITGWLMHFMSRRCVCFMVMLMVVAFHLWGRGVSTIGAMGVFGLCVEGAHRQGEAAEEEEGAWRHKRISHGKGLSGG
jgi:hypothetical protein